jgi:outer membrane protein assembly factor BamB
MIVIGLAAVIGNRAPVLRGADAPATAPAASAPAGQAAGGIVGWRNDGTGRYPDAQPVTTWSEKKNVLWKAELGKNSYGCPIVVGDKVFVEAEPDVLFCVSRTDGKILWQKPNGIKDIPEAMRPKEEPQLNPEGAGGTAPTPVSDGKCVYAAFGTGVVACYDMDGNRKWVQFFEQDVKSAYGRSAAPLLVDGKLILSLGNLTAVDPATGKVLWDAKESEATYGTPVATKIGDAWVIVTPKGDVVALADGKILATGIGQCGYASPSVADGVVYFIGKSCTAYKLPAKITDKFGTKDLWSADVDEEVYSSAVCDDGLVYVLNSLGRYYALDAQTGKPLVDKVLEMPPAGEKSGSVIFASVCLAGKKVFLFNGSGDATILAAGKEFKQIGTSALGDGSAATPAFAGKQIFIRGSSALYCIGEK